MKQKVGVNGLRKHYGSKCRRGTHTNINRKAAGKNIRYCLIQLEAAGLVGKVQFQSDDKNTVIMGKSLTKKGITDMDRIASQIVKELRK